jgi:hypothetical protein
MTCVVLGHQPFFQPHWQYLSPAWLDQGTFCLQGLAALAQVVLRSLDSLTHNGVSLEEKTVFQMADCQALAVVKRTLAESF